MKCDGHIDLMAILNVTDDSFYAPSRVSSKSEIEHRVERFISEGATIIDVGGCSSRPGSQPSDEATEWQRVLDAITAVRRVSKDVVISIDTFRSGIVRRAELLLGRFIVNDISSMEADEGMLQTVLSLRLPIVLMHMRGNPSTMQTMCQYGNVCTEVRDYLLSRAELLVRNGHDRNDIIIDPGFGFAKTLRQNYQLLSHLRAFSETGYRVLAGLSRKSMITSLLDIEPEQALAPTQVLLFKALTEGASILRVHDVKEAAMTVKIFRELSNYHPV